MRKIVLLLILMTTVAQAQMNIIPKPTRVEMGKGVFFWDAQTRIKIKGLKKTAFEQSLSEFEKNIHKEGVSTNNKESKLTKIVLFLLDKKADTLGDEGYLLKIDENAIKVTAYREAGLFYALQSIRQMMEDAYRTKVGSYSLQSCTIYDKPRFVWRGFLFDCCRHFFDKATVKKYIDLLAYYKMNRLHWHLTEDQGWRIEIKKYPKLTSVGAWRTEADGTVYGGFYTQDDIREIVQYAKQRHVEVIPEIELPGHSLAALAAYPELSCTGGPHKVETNWGVFKDIYCAGNDQTIQFMKDVMNEVCQLFPSTYIHIGGDEAPKYRWEHCNKCQERIKKEGLKNTEALQGWFIRQMEDYLSKKGRRLIGWDEIIEGGLSPMATIQSWRGMEGAIHAAQTGHDAIVSPTSHAYLDYDIKTHNLERVYSFEPVPEELSPELSKHILGGECNIWTERVTYENLDSRVFPRFIAMAEVLWSSGQQKNFADFRRRIQTHYPILAEKGVKFGFESEPLDITSAYDAINRKLSVTLHPSVAKLNVEIVKNGSASLSLELEQPYTITVTDSLNLVVKTQPLTGGAINVYKRKYLIHKASGLLPETEGKYSQNYTGGGDYALTDCRKGSEMFRDGIWQAIQGTDLITVVDLQSEQSIHRFSCGFLQSTPSWIFYPRRVEFYTSVDGVNYSLAGTVENKGSDKDESMTTSDFILDFAPLKARYVKMKAVSMRKCPEWHDAAGSDSWLFYDEFTVE